MDGHATRVSQRSLHCCSLTTDLLQHSFHPFSSQVETLEASLLCFCMVKSDFSWQACNRDAVYLAKALIY